MEFFLSTSKRETLIEYAEGVANVNALAKGTFELVS